MLRLVVLVLTYSIRMWNIANSNSAAGARGAHARVTEGLIQPPHLVQFTAFEAFVAVTSKLQTSPCEGRSPCRIHSDY